MSDVDSLIDTLHLPIPLPPDTFAMIGGRPIIADFEKVVEQLPSQLAAYIDLNGTSTRFGDDSYHLKLTDGGFVRITIIDQSIVAVSKVK